MGRLSLDSPLTKEQVQRFKQIILDKKGIDLTDDEAFDQATRWFKLSKLVMLYDINDSIVEVQKKGKNI